MAENVRCVHLHPSIRLPCKNGTRCFETQPHARMEKEGTATSRPEHVMHLGPRKGATVRMATGERTIISILSGLFCSISMTFLARQPSWLHL